LERAGAAYRNALAALGLNRDPTGDDLKAVDPKSAGFAKAMSLLNDARGSFQRPDVNLNSPLTRELASKIFMLSAGLEFRTACDALGFKGDPSDGDFKPIDPESKSYKDTKNYLESAIDLLQRPEVDSDSRLARELASKVYLLSAELEYGAACGALRINEDITDPKFPALTHYLSPANFEAVQKQFTEAGQHLDLARKRATLASEVNPASVQAHVIISKAHVLSAGILTNTFVPDTQMDIMKRYNAMSTSWTAAADAADDAVKALAVSEKQDPALVERLARDSIAYREIAAAAFLQVQLR
jgi:hypothetical protein